MEALIGKPVSKADFRNPDDDIRDERHISHAGGMSCPKQGCQTGKLGHCSVI